MIAGSSRVVAAALVLVPASAAAGTGTARSPIALTATPSHVALEGSASAAVRVRNFGSSRVVVDVTRSGFALDLRGRPKITRGGGGSRSAAGWLTFRPRSLAIRPGGSAVVGIQSKVPPGVEPGDHDALVLLTTRRQAQDGVAVRMRMGVVVVVRAPGRIIHRLRLVRLRVVETSRRRTRELELLVANAGNVTESIERSKATISLFSGGRRIARLRAEPRELRPGTRGILRFRRPRRELQHLVARAEVTLDGGLVVRRSFRIRA